MAKARLAATAQADLRQIRAYSKAAFGAAAAFSYVEDLRAAFHIIGDRPLAGRTETEFGECVRSFPCRSHRIYYRASKGEVTIVRILHQAQDAAMAMERLH